MTADDTWRRAAARRLAVLGASRRRCRSNAAADDALVQRMRHMSRPSGAVGVTAIDTILLLVPLQLLLQSGAAPGWNFTNGPLPRVLRAEASQLRAVLLSWQIPRVPSHALNGPVHSWGQTVHFFRLVLSP